MATVASGNAAAAPHDAHAAHNVDVSQLMNALNAINGTLKTLSDRVARIEDRLGQEKTTASPTTAMQVPAEMARAKEAAAAAMRQAEVERLQAEAAVRQEEIDSLQAAARAAEEVAASCQAETESLQAALTAVREACQCPILNDFTADMVVASDGHGYDRQALQQWRQKDNSSPVTREPLQPILFPNRFGLGVFEELRKFSMQTGRSTSRGARSSSTDPHQDLRPGTLSAALFSPALEDAAAPEPGALVAAINRGDEATVLRLLRRPQLPGLNDVDHNGWTVLHLAILRRLQEAASRILAEPAFLRINAKSRWGSTALHCAAEQGFLSTVRAILRCNHFTELLALNCDRRTAMQVARCLGHEGVAECLRDAENQVFEATV